MPSNIYDLNLDKNPANYQPLTPLSFLRRTADVYPNRIAVVHGDVKFTYAEFYARCRRLASALSKRGIGRGDTVAILSPQYSRKCWRRIMACRSRGRSSTR